LLPIPQLDDNLARIRAALSELGLLESTNIILTSDHASRRLEESQTSST